MAEPTRLPSSSLAELKKIIQGYSHFGDKVQLDDLARLLGIHKNTISPNNPALTELGIIEGGNTKSTTPLGMKLGRALEHDYHEDVQKSFREIIQNSGFLSGIISTIRIKRGMTHDDLASHILYASGQKNNKNNRTGARTYVDMLIESALVVEENGSVVVATSDISTTPTPFNDTSSASEDQSTAGESEPLGGNLLSTSPENKHDTKSSSPLTKISINVQLQIPATENAQVYENLFKALREHLLEPSETNNEQ